MWIYGSETAVSDISSNLVRLHIIADSNSERDQAIKLSVRDRLLTYVSESGASWKKEDFYNKQNELKEQCDTYLKTLGAEYQCEIDIGTFYFPTKQYENITLPAGNYEAVKLVLGKGEGENWWCVMSPPLCFTNETRGEMKSEDLRKLEEGMGKENYALIYDEENIEIKPAFKLVEWWQEIKHAIFG